MSVPLRCSPIILFALACGGEAPRDEAPAAVLITPGVAWPESLVVTAPSGTEVWFTSGREATGPDGTACVERTMQIRTADTALIVPLLYTGAAPELVDDSTLLAHVWNGCQPGRAYHVDLRTGRPTALPE